MWVMILDLAEQFQRDCTQLMSMKDGCSLQDIRIIWKNFKWLLLEYTLYMHIVICIQHNIYLRDICQNRSPFPCMDGLQGSVNSCIASVRPESHTLQNRNDVYPQITHQLCCQMCCWAWRDGSIGSVQESENTIPKFTWKAFEVLIRRVQSPVPFGDISLRVQLGLTLIWNVLPAVDSIPRSSALLWSPCSSQE